MADKIRIRLYNILLGDAILVTIPDKSKNGKPKKRHILIDVGNKPGGIGADKSLFEPIIKNIIAELDGNPLDLYVMTHEHMDHVQGLLYAAQKLDIDIKQVLAPQYVWLTGSSAEDYYKDHPEAKKQKSLALDAFDEARHLFATEDTPPFLRTLLELNDPRATKDCVDFLRELSDETHFIDRETDVSDKHPFRTATFTIWAPEEDTSVYYGKFQPLGLTSGGITSGGAPASAMPPPGVDAGAFYDLVRARQSGAGDNLLAIDKAANNTSIVFCLEWNGKKLLFCGDAEERSWMEMKKQGVLEEVDFLKIGHHGSHNGTPGTDILDVILPKGKKKRQAAISTCLKAYSGIPDDPTLKEIGKRATIHSTLTDSEPGGWVDVFV